MSYGIYIEWHRKVGFGCHHKDRLTVCFLSLSTGLVVNGHVPNVETALHVVGVVFKIHHFLVDSKRQHSALPSGQNGLFAVADVDLHQRA